MAAVRHPLLLIFAASFLSALGLRLVEAGEVPWALSRASGLTAFGTLSLATIGGLLVSTKAGDGVISRPFAFEMHQFLSVLSLVLIAVHAGSLLFDGFLGFTPASLLIPFASSYRPLAVALGVVAAWLASITTASYWMRRQIGQKRWRALHYATFIAYLGALWHGIAAGTDTQVTVIYWGYLVSGAAVCALLMLRIVGYSTVPRRRPAPEAGRRAA